MPNAVVNQDLRTQGVSGRWCLKGQRCTLVPLGANGYMSRSPKLVERVGGFSAMINRGVGIVNIRHHRPIPNGAILKQVQIIKKADGWYINLRLQDVGKMSSHD